MRRGQGIRVWDPVVRLFHWSLVAGFTANAFFTDDDGAPHRWVGYGVVGLVVIRVIWGLIGTRHARFSDFPPSARAAMGQVRDEVAGRVQRHLGHTPLGALMIYNLLATMLALGLSGWGMTVGGEDLRDAAEEAHEALVIWAQFCVVLHIAAVIWESRKTGVNLVSAMITGRKHLRK